MRPCASAARARRWWRICWAWVARIVLKRPYADGTVAVDLDPLSLLARLAASVPPPRHHTVRYSGVLAAASQWRSRIAPYAEPDDEPRKKRRSRYRPWAELLTRTFGVDALACPACQGRMRLVALVRNPLTIAWHLARIGAPIELPERSPDRGADAEITACGLARIAVLTDTDLAPGFRSWVALYVSPQRDESAVALAHEPQGVAAAVRARPSVRPSKPATSTTPRCSRHSRSSTAASFPRSPMPARSTRSTAGEWPIWRARRRQRRDNAAFLARHGLAN